MLRDLKRRLREAVPPVIFLLLTVYFVWNAIQGNRGLESYAKQQQLLNEANADQTRAADELAKWERRVAELRANHIDPDMLDERSRAMLNRTNPNDVIIQYGPKDRLSQSQ